MSKHAWMVGRSRTLKATGIVVLAIASVFALGCGSQPGTEQGPQLDAANTAAGDGGDAASSVEGGPSGHDASNGADATTGDDGPNSDAGMEAGSDASAAMDVSSCVPRPIDCTGLCGPVTDPCSGQTKQCGGCAAGTVCDLAGHTCVTPKTSCADLIPGPSHCGVIQNSCGDFLNCGDCPNGSECDPQTNTCVTCIPVTCKDLGAQCGPVWNGCGRRNDPANLIQCPSCASASVCNNAFNVCEPRCAAQSPAAACAAAKAASGVQCGIITDGCGGTVNCDLVPGFGCSNGQLCGVAGLSNHCDNANTPVDCTVLQKTCGTVTSSCTGQQVSCGTCTKSGEVCNQNGVCGPPCTPNDCSSQAIIAVNGGSVPQCGTFPDGCGGTVACGPCATGSVCASNNTCCKVTGACAANQCGLVANGCGGQLDCSNTCTGGTTCDPVKSACCTPKTCAQAAPACGASVDNGCHGTMACPTCAGAEVCNTQTKACCTPFKCADHYAGMCGTFPDGCGGVVDCRNACSAGHVCNATTMTCCVPTACGAQCGTVSDGCGGTQVCGCPTGQVCDLRSTQCCTPIPHAMACSAPGRCGLVSDGCGNTEECDCSSGQVCNSQTSQCCTPFTCAANYAGMCGLFDDHCGGILSCKPPYTCNSPQYAGKCDTGAFASPPFSDGCNGTLSCGCSGTATCGGGGVPNVCGCTRLTCQSPSIAPRCGTFGDGCGAMLNCTAAAVCMPGQVCNVSGSPPANTCCTPTTCAAVLATKPAGTCGTFGDGCGGSLNCTGVCTGGQICNTSISSTTGQPADLCCAPLTCSAPQYAGKCGNFSNGCGGTLQCNNVNCGAAQVCNPLTSSCCTPKTCAADYPGQCGNHDDGCGNPTGLSCNNCAGTQVCNTGNNQCCTPQTCATNHPLECGNFPDGCGGTLHCNCTNSIAGPVCSTAAANQGMCCTAATCPGPAGGGGVPPGGVCGTIPDGCGGNASCSPCQQYPIPGIATAPGGGSCGPTNTCTLNVSGSGSKCVCVPLGCADNCGNPRTGHGIPDGCGGTVNCGG